MAVERGLGPSSELICEIVDSVGQEIIYLSGKSQGILVRAVPFL